MIGSADFGRYASGGEGLLVLFGLGGISFRYR